MILADGVVDLRELEMLYKIGIEQYGLTQTEITETVRDAGSSFIIPETLNQKVRFLYNLVQIANADGKIDDSELDLLHRYILKMGFSEDNIHGIEQFLIESVKNGLSEDEVLRKIAD